MSARQILTKAADGCHKYGWLLNIITTLLMLAFMTGRYDQKISDLSDQVKTMQAQIFDLAHITRNIPDNMPLPPIVGAPKQ